MYVRTIGSVLPVIEPAPLASLKLPIDHPNWLFELKHDGFRGMLYADRDRGWLRSRTGNEMRRFDALSQQIRALLKGQRVILDGEIVVLDSEGRSIFADLMMGRGEASYCAFDLVWLNGRLEISSPEAAPGLSSRLGFGRTADAGRRAATGKQTNGRLPTVLPS